jgi:hypothetical protein
LGSPLSEALQKLRPDQDPSTSPDSDWFNETSREDLAELLLKADDLIKERETGVFTGAHLAKIKYSSTHLARNRRHLSRVQKLVRE